MVSTKAEEMDENLKMLREPDDDDSDDCVGVAIQQRSRQSSPCPIAWMNHHDSLRLSDIKDRNRGTIAENNESGLEYS